MQYMKSTYTTVQERHPARTKKRYGYVCVADNISTDSLASTITYSTGTSQDSILSISEETLEEDLRSVESSNGDSDQMTSPSLPSEDVSLSDSVFDPIFS